MFSCFRSSVQCPRTAREKCDTQDSAPASQDIPPSYSSLLSNDSSTKLASLRKAMKDLSLDYYVIGTADPHQTEYIGPSQMRLRWISGFSGTAAHAIVSKDAAWVFVNGIYWIQAEREVCQDWKIEKVGQPGVLDWQDFLCAHGSTDGRIGIDADLFSYSTLSSLATKILPTRGMQLVFTEEILIDKLWVDRPALPTSRVFEHDIRFAGVPAEDKLSKLNDYIQKEQAQGYLLSDLSEIAWLFNMRGNDIDGANPLFYAYALVTRQEKVLFIRAEQVSPALEAYLQRLKVKRQPYESVQAYLRDSDWSGGPLLMSAQTPYAMMLAVGQSRFRVVTSPVTIAKAIKNPVEIAGHKATYERDAVAWTRWIADLTERIQKNTRVTEYEAAQLLIKYCSDQDHWFSPSYEPLVQTGANGALPHYAPTPEETDVIDPSKLLVVDIGQQYLDATTDTTRTYHFKPEKATNEQRRAFTRVLQGHIAVETTRFPAGTSGAALDILARRALWQDRQDYQHGTGHGIGTFLTVHEGPCAINKALTTNTTPLQPGHILSNEPGYYKKGEYGIRLESAILVTKQPDENWLGFDRLTRVPIQTSLVDFKLLSPQEKGWLKTHNDLCRKVVLPHLQRLGDRRAIKWLKGQ